MKFVLFCHSLASDWNHGNAHFLRGVVAELQARGHVVETYEPHDGWSRRNLIEDQGEKALERFALEFRELASRLYDPATMDVDAALEGADVVIVHEWTDPSLVARIGRSGSRMRARVFFHDTHHRSVTDPDAIAALDLSGYQGVLAFGREVANRYLHNGWTQLAWIWHEAADVRRFRPLPTAYEGDVVWIGNWGDGERGEELEEFLIGPIARLGVRARVYGVRYPQAALAALEAAGIEYGGWAPNYEVPEIFARFRCTVHIPRRIYADTLKGVPTIRIFEALACGIPLICAPWDDVERLFRPPGEDYLVARNGQEMERRLRDVLERPALAASLGRNGRDAILSRHTCAHRVDELLQIIAALDEASRHTPHLRSPAPHGENDGAPRASTPGSGR